ncbi:MAG: AEC family transporter [Myxococcaceae bacterium]
MLSSLTLLASCFGLGFVTRRINALPPTTPEVLNKLILNIALPAVVIRSVRTLAFEPRLLVAASMMWLVFGVAFLLFSFWGRRGLGKDRAAALILTVGFCNTAYLGLPLVEALLGPDAVGTAVVVDQLGSFLAVSTVGIGFAASASGKSTTGAQILFRVLRFPPFLALVAALLLRGTAFPPWGENVLSRLAELMTPLALIAVGFQLELSAIAGRTLPVTVGLVFKLALAPAVVYLTLYSLGGRGLTLQVAVLQSAMAPMVAGAILAMEKKLDPPLSALLLGLGIPLSIATVPFISWVLTQLPS